MIDALDRKLIQELQKSGRRGYVELAKELGVVEGTVLQAKLVELKRWMMN
jgi:DNA-binding Lrp family transcriptional regulator